MATDASKQMLTGLETSGERISDLISENKVLAQQLKEAQDKVSDIGQTLGEIIRNLEAESAQLKACVEDQKREIARLKTVPMKYRRMEFNAQLQKELSDCEQEIATLTEYVEKYRVMLKEAGIL